MLLFEEAILLARTSRFIFPIILEVFVVSDDMFDAHEVDGGNDLELPVEEAEPHDSFLFVGTFTPPSSTNISLSLSYKSGMINCGIIETSFPPPLPLTAVTTRTIWIRKNGGKCIRPGTLQTCVGSTRTPRKDARGESARLSTSTQTATKARTSASRAA